MNPGAHERPIKIIPLSFKTIGGWRENAFSYLIPVFTGIFSYIFISEIFTINKITGMLTVILGVAITQMKETPVIKQT